MDKGYFYLSLKDLVKRIVKFAALTSFVVSISAASTQAQDPDKSVNSPSEVGSPWHSLTRADVEAAYHLLHDNHPAASPEANNPVFVAALQRAYEQALSRAATVRSMEGYMATLRELSLAMDDGHIWFNPKFTKRTLSWAGIIAAKRGASWIVDSADKAVVGADITGARIIACDAEPVSGLARKVMHFRSCTHKMIPNFLKV